MVTVETRGRPRIEELPADDFHARMIVKSREYYERNKERKKVLRDEKNEQRRLNEIQKLESAGEEVPKRLLVKEKKEQDAVKRPRGRPKKTSSPVDE